ncbi:MAG: trypsin-like peptidase domain-containing protein [Planctomycetota bacterium]
MQRRPDSPSSLWLSCVLIAAFAPLLFPAAHATADDARKTPLVLAVEGCSPSVVNLRGRKTVPNTDATAREGELKQVNGMGTGVVIDPRGYILTNYHVVEGVARIEVTTSDRYQTTGRLVAHDPVTDLAVIKIDVPDPMPVIRIGSSSDLMLAETVAAVGNAYGYEHTVTVGIISQLGRTVQVNEEQIYRNLIQTDAPINPGNSGGPLLNLNGDMIGINVAVRMGAQGIAFAIPVNDAMEIAARMISEVVDNEIYHGIVARTVYVDDAPRLIVDDVQEGSPAATAGIHRGDEIIAVSGQPTGHELDLHRSLITAAPQQALRLTVQNDNGPQDVNVVLASSVSRPPQTTNESAWTAVGMRLAPVSADEMGDKHPNYQRGLRVLSVRPASPAESAGIAAGDILVAMHGWKTETMDNLAYILEQPDIKDQKEFMFFVLRDKKPFFGQMRIASRRSP